MASFAAPSVSMKQPSSLIPSPQNPPSPKPLAISFTSMHHNKLSYSAHPKTPMAISEKTSSSSNTSSTLGRDTGPIIVIDNYDSFTYNLCQYMGELGCEFEVYRNDELTVDELKGKNPRGVLISPGPGTPQDSGISLQTVLELGPTVPLFGVCMGLQCIGEAFGGKIVRSPYGVMHGKSSPVYYNEGGEDGLFAGLSNPFTAGRYHSLVIEKESFPSDVLEITAWTEDGLIMAARHKVYRHLQKGELYAYTSLYFVRESRLRVLGTIEKPDSPYFDDFLHSEEDQATSTIPNVCLILQGVQFHPESIITSEGKTIVQNFIKLIERKEAAGKK